MGVLFVFWCMGIDWCFYVRMFWFFIEVGIKWIEVGYVMGNNLMMNCIIWNIGGKLVKMYKVLARFI